MNEQKQIALENERIEIRFPYSEGLVQRVKQIPEVMWDNDSKCWFTRPTKYYAEHAQKLANEYQFMVTDGVYRLIRSTKKNGRVAGLYEYQKEAVDFIDRNYGTCLLSEDMGCISGDAEIIINRGGAGRRYTIKDAYERFHGKASRYNWDPHIPSYTRSIDENTKELRLNRIKDIIFKGFKDTVSITTFDGHELYLTPDHEVLTESGWVQAGDLRFGNLIYTNGTLACPICGSSDNIVSYTYSEYRGYCKECVRRHKRRKKNIEGSIDADGYVRIYSMFNHPNVTDQNYVVQHRLVFEAYMNGVPYDKWVSMCEYGFDGEYEFLSPNVVIHHRNGDKSDNIISNLEAMSTQDHMRLHGDPNRLTIFMKSKLSIIKSVDKHTVSIPVYDIVMEDPNRSFVANGIIVHNCGKTIEALAYIKEQDLRQTLVICPASVLYKWQDEITKWCGWDSQVILTGKAKINPDMRVLIMSYAIMVKRIYELRDIEFDMIVADEAHYIVNPKARRSVAYGMLSGKRKLFLSGTPFLNRPIELFNILHHINPLRWQSYWAYAQRYAGAEKKTIWTKGGQRQVWDVNGATNLDELKEKISPIVLRRTKREVLTGLPDLVRTKISIDISNKREYNQAKLDLKNWMKSNGKEGTTNALSKLNVLRQIIGRGKVNAAVELAEEALLNPDRKVVLYAHHREVVDMLKEALLPYGVDTIVGDDSNTKRANTVNKFQNFAHPRVLVISSAGGEGIDLYRADTMIVVEREWNAGKESQAEGRLHRNGQKNSVQVYYLVGRDTIDVDIDELIVHKSDIFDIVIGSDDIRVEVLNRMK